MMEDFLETTPLYQRQIIVNDGQWGFYQFGYLPAITTYCLNCRSNHTFNAVQVDENDTGSYQGSHHAYSVQSGSIHRLVYQCKKCDQFQKEFLVQFTSEYIKQAKTQSGHYITYGQKVGQYPAPSIEVEKDMEAYLDDKNLELYKHGVISESQGYGVGAFAYYRQVIENQIDSLLDAMLKFADEDQQEELRQKIAQAKQRQDTADKIDIVKDALPTQLKPAGNNVLKLIYSALSDGLHNRSDAECLLLSQNLRGCLVFLVKKIQEQKRDEREFKKAVTALQNNAQAIKPKN